MSVSPTGQLGSKPVNTPNNNESAAAPAPSALERLMNYLFGDAPKEKPKPVAPKAKPVDPYYEAFAYMEKPQPLDPNSFEARMAVVEKLSPLAKALKNNQG
jgi:hypothetical protein